ncbi:MAG TPA: glycosyl hydrolase [Spirochaetia bacterium]|nr:glycosyl hydrolase [Spirochaetia bacterium]
MIHIDSTLRMDSLQKELGDLFSCGTRATTSLRSNWDPSRGTPVFTVDGLYTSRGWTEWTQGFVFGNAIYLFDATGDTQMLNYARTGTLQTMATHITHTGVHDHGFNNASTYGNLLRLMEEGRLPENEWEDRFLRLALRVSGAVQATRWTELRDDLGYVYSFNGPHSLFSDTIRSMRVLALSHALGHTLMGEQDRKISLLRRLLQHAETTARYNVYFGTGRDIYDIRGRVAHESIFNITNGAYRCPSTQQGYSPYSTWTRGLAWILCGYAEELEYLRKVGDREVRELELPYFPSLAEIERRFLETACAVADFYIENTPADGVPYWDTGAPGLIHMGDYLDRPSDPFNQYEPVDSSAAAIAAQGLLRLGAYMGSRTGQADRAAARYLSAGLTVAKSIFSDPYLSREERHQGILLHSVYHRPNGWDHIPEGRHVAAGESCMWGDYHALELGVYLQRLAGNGPYLTFFGGIGKSEY